MVWGVSKCEKTHLNRYNAVYSHWIQGSPWSKTPIPSGHTHLMVVAGFDARRTTNSYFKDVEV